MLLMKAYPFLQRELLQCDLEYGKTLVAVSDILNIQISFGEK